MIKSKSVLAMIPARGGSKGIKDKNIKDLNGKPLIAYTIQAAKNSQYIDRVVLTTDSKRIADVGRLFGVDVPFMRPAEMALDHSKSIDAVIHGLRMLEAAGDSYDILVWLQPTSPLRSSDDIDRALEHFLEMGERGLVSVSPVDDHPILIRSIGEDGCVIKLLNTCSTCRRQDMPAFYKVDGAIYIFKTTELDENTSMNDAPIPFVMKKVHAIDMDEIADFYLAEWFLNESERHIPEDW